MHVFVSGGASFIGGHLCRCFLSDDHHATAIDHFYANLSSES